MDYGHTSVAYWIDGKLHLITGFVGTFYMKLDGTDEIALIHDHARAVEIVRSYYADSWKVITEDENGDRLEDSFDGRLPPQSETMEDR